MPGTIATVPAHVGQKLAKGEALLTLEAMKMKRRCEPSATE